MSSKRFFTLSLRALFFLILIMGLQFQEEKTHAQSLSGYPIHAKAKVVDEARVEAFANIRQRIDLSDVPKNDPQYLQNQAALRRKVDIVGDRMFTRFQNGGYSVSKLCNQYTYYYYPNGNLMLVEEESSPTYFNASCKEQFPKKSFKYSYPSGRLTGVSIDPSNFESFVFAPDETLAFHYVGERCYDHFGRPCGRRETFQIIPPRKTVRVGP
jgi:hypothetical protein